MSSDLVPAEYHAFLTDIKERIRSAQYEALKSVNKELIVLYWDIGRMIVERQQGATWGKSVVARLAEDLQAEFPGIGGFSASNLWRMRGFYEAYAAKSKLAPLVREIGWSHNLIVLEKCKDDLEREFYLRMTRKFGLLGHRFLCRCLHEMRFCRAADGRGMGVCPRFFGQVAGVE